MCYLLLNKRQSYWFYILVLNTRARGDIYRQLSGGYCVVVGLVIQVNRKEKSDGYLWENQELLLCLSYLRCCGELYKNE